MTNRDTYTFKESPHEHQQSLLLSRIITNVVCGQFDPGTLTRTSHSWQEKLNEAIMAMNNSLQVGIPHFDTDHPFLRSDFLIGDQYSEHEC